MTAAEGLTGETVVISGADGVGIAVTEAAIVVTTEVDVGATAGDSAIVGEIEADSEVVEADSVVVSAADDTVESVIVADSVETVPVLQVDRLAISHLAHPRVLPVAMPAVMAAEQTVLLLAAQPGLSLPSQSFQNHVVTMTAVDGNTTTEAVIENIVTVTETTENAMDTAAVVDETMTTAAADVATMTTETATEIVIALIAVQSAGGIDSDIAENACYLYYSGE
jgi:hypothetical protein